MEGFKIILQARASSKRLPGKMLKVFFNGWTIPEIVIRNLLKIFNAKQIILATSIHGCDDELQRLAENLGIDCFRGEEQDVLKRFIDAATYGSARNVVRVCADNPFIQPESLLKLLQEFDEIDADYLSYRLSDGTPIIKSHLGLFAEIVTFESLLRVARLTDEPDYHEHVTNFIYTNPDLFAVQFLDLPDFINDRTDIRLTIDTEEDFILGQEIYSEVYPDCGVVNIIEAVDSCPSRLLRMKNQIIQNSK